MEHKEIWIHVFFNELKHTQCFNHKQGVMLHFGFDFGLHRFFERWMCLILILIVIGSDKFAFLFMFLFTTTDGNDVVAYVQV